MTMWRTKNEIEADLHSADSERVAAALETLEFHVETMEPVDVEAPTPEDLACFGDELPDEVASRLVKVVGQFETFAPALDVDQRAALLARFAVRFGPSSLALEASLVAKMADASAAATRAALDAVAGETTRSVERAGELVSYFLAGDAEVRGAAIEVLAGWHADPTLAAIVGRVTGELDDEERARIAA